MRPAQASTRQVLIGGEHSLGVVTHVGKAVGHLFLVDSRLEVLLVHDLLGVRFDCSAPTGDRRRFRAVSPVLTTSLVDPGERLVGNRLHRRTRAKHARVRRTMPSEVSRLEPRDGVLKIVTSLAGEALLVISNAAYSGEDPRERVEGESIPIGANMWGHESIALGGAVGAVLASPHSATILEEGGVEFGIHKDNRVRGHRPVRWDNGYAMFTVGDTGSGKSFSSKQNFIRSIEQEEDRLGIVLKPLNNWVGVSETLNASKSLSVRHSG